MSVAERILQHHRYLPEPAQAEVLDFVESELSLAQAMRGMEGEPSLYTPADIKEALS